MASQEKVSLSLKDLVSDSDYKRIIERVKAETIEALNIYPEQVDIDEDCIDDVIVVTVGVHY